MKLSVVIPVFNEVKTIKEVIEKVKSVKLTPGWQKEIIIVDDGSTDGTKKIIEDFEDGEIKKLFHPKNQGKGTAVRDGIKTATGEVLIIQDADLEYDPKYFLTLLEPITSKRAEVVFGTRLKNLKFKLFGRDKTPLPLHLLANRFLSVLTNFLYHSRLTDMETGYKLMTKEVYQNLNLISDRFEVEPEITAKILKKGYQIIEIPIFTKPRSYREGKKIKPIDALMAAWTLVRFAFISS